MNNGLVKQLLWLATAFAAFAAYQQNPLFSRQPSDSLMNEFESAAFVDARFLFAPANSSLSPEIKQSLTTPFFGTIVSLFEENVAFKSQKDKIKDVLLLARNFRRPRGFGINRFDGCFVIRPAGSSEIGYFSKLAVAQKVKDTPIYALEASSSPISIGTSFFVVQLRNHVVVIATTIDLARLIVEWSLTHSWKSDPSALVGLSKPPTEPFWLYRSYRTSFHSDPEVSGLILDSGLRIGADASDLFFAVNGSAKGEAVLSYVSSSSRDQTPTVLNSGGFNFRQRTALAWDSKISLEPSEEAKGMLAAVFTMFGFAIYA